MNLSLLEAMLSLAGEGEGLSPQISRSSNYKSWNSIEDEKRCMACAGNNGRIWYIEDIPHPQPPVHPNCRCSIEVMQAIIAGTATIDGIKGADWTLKNNGELPEYYIDGYEASLLGWKPGKWPSNFVPGKIISAGIYKNFDGRLPQEFGRVWYEADINYISGKRNSQRVVWSNDGLVFVTYDHYKTFFEIV